MDGIWSLWRAAIVTAAWGAFFTVYGRGLLAWAGVAVLAASAAFLGCCLLQRVAKQPPVWLGNQDSNLD